MPYPSRAEYTRVVRDHFHRSILDPKLKGGKARGATEGHLVEAYSGSFSIVFPIDVLSKTYALRCWIQDIGNAESRYQAISDYLKQHRLLYFVDFDYVSEGTLVNGTKYPITRMEWAEGETLCDFIEHNLQDAQCLRTAAAEFQKMVKTLHAHKISHGDLQDGNILLKRNGTDVEIKLIDYDSLFVPALRGQPDSIVGLPEYQHPQRIAGGGQANEKVDYFSELAIYLSVLSLAEKPDLWSQFGKRTEKGLLFTAEDFENPDQSDVFRKLKNLSSDVKQLASKLKEFCEKTSIDQLEPLEAILPKTSPPHAYDQGIAYLKQLASRVKEFCKPSINQPEPLEGVLLKTSSADIAHKQGIAYLHSEQYNEAIVEFKKAVTIDPKFKEAYHGLGLAYLQMRNFVEAKKGAESALRIDPRYQPTLELLDVIKSPSIPSVTPPTQSTGLPKTTSTKEKSKDYNDSGVNHNRKREYDKAIVNFTKAIDLNPNYAEAHKNRGVAYRLKGEFDHAIKDFTKAIDLNPNYAEAHKNRGVAYRLKGEFDHAIKDFTKAIDLNPNYAEAHKNRGVAYRLKGEFDHAIKDFTNRPKSRLCRNSNLAKASIIVTSPKPITIAGWLTTARTSMIKPL